MADNTSNNPPNNGNSVNAGATTNARLQQPVTRSQTQAAQRSNQSGQFSQADLNRIVLEYLNKKGYHKTESMLRLESSHTPTPSVSLPNTATSFLTNPSELGGEDNTILTQELKDLRSKQLTIEQELRDIKDLDLRLAKEKELRELKDYEARKRRETNPDVYEIAYNALRKWVDSSLDLYKPELSKILYPIFIHCYLELIYKEFTAEAKRFFDKFKVDHEVLHGEELKTMSGVSLPDHLQENETAKSFRTHKYRIIISKTSMDLLLYFLHENEAVGGAILIKIINQFLNPIIKITQPDKLQLVGDANPEEGLALNDDINEIEKFNAQASVSLGKLPLEPEIQEEIEAELKVKDEEQVEKGQTHEKSLVEEFQAMTAVETDSPVRDSLPLPLKDYSDIRRYIKEVEDSRSKIKLDTIQASAPSVCMYTFHNTNNNLTCLEFNQDATILAGGFQDSYIQLWSIDGKSLKSVFKRDSKNGDNTRKLIGHSGPVYSASFSPDNRFMVSSSEDKTVRLWSLDSFSGLVSYRGHSQPVWDVKFSPLGHYFATASHDQTARLWATDHIYPLRIFAGHINDVDCIDFHPNSNYVFTGSSDKTCRMWDVHSGNTARVFMGHTGPINCLAVSPDGRWLASAGEDSVINIWDVGSGRKLKSMRGHGRSSIYSLQFSRDNGVLVSGGADNTVRVWDVRKNTNDAGPEPEVFNFDDDDKDVNGTTSRSSATKKSNANRKEIVATTDHMTAYFTKKTPVYKVHFTRRNLCLAAGPFLG